MLVSMLLLGGMRARRIWEVVVMLGDVLGFTDRLANLEPCV